MTVLFRPFLAGDIVQLALQPSQHVTLGISQPVHDIEDGRELEQSSPTAWTAQADGRLLACAGLRLLWPAGEGTAGHAVAWALLAADLGAAHVAITRFFRDVVANDPCTRIEAIVRADVAAECRWARMVGFELAAVLRAWGPEAKTHWLFERVRTTPGEQAIDLDRRTFKLEALGAV